jgi:acyl transferase domain-containing protein/NADPH:quinone reductase-like Zn-dependent oxidoreductase/acyl carrier protein
MIVSSASQERILQALRDARALVAAVGERAREPVAIVGIGCRFPGGIDGPDALWRVVSEGIDATSEQPPDRWDVAQYYDPDPLAKGKIYTRRGGFVSDVDRFDADFFGISPREAAAMDPQQRMLLEVTWEAIEHAGVSAEELRGSNTAVFMGQSWRDYDRVSVGNRADRLDAYSGMGNTPSISVGRLAYVLDLRGPVSLLDTACSSSLVAVHAAVRSLQTYESDAALAGGVNLILSPLSTVFCCKIQALSPDGRCKTFDASADGYARAEGCGVVMLKRLSDARRDRNVVYALIRGTAVNHDGRAGGLTVPSAHAQQDVIRKALQAAGCRAEEVAYVEAHGTGTALGDPIEAGALQAVYGARASERPLWVGSIKTNFGHAETAAGIAGLIKAAMAIRHGVIPPSLHFERPNPRIAWDDCALRVPTRPQPWPEGPRVAGVSSFGFSGTNAHVLVAEPPAEALEPSRAEACHLLTLSARSLPALRSISERFSRRLMDLPQEELADLVATSHLGRAKFEHRLAVSGRGPRELAHALGAYARGERAPAVRVGHVPRGHAVKVALLFSDQDARLPPIDPALYDRSDAYQAAISACAEAIQADAPAGSSDASLRPAVPSAPAQDARTTFFVRQFALARLLCEWNVPVGATYGVGVGECVAACIAGSISLPGALAHVRAHGRDLAGLERLRLGEVPFVASASARRVDAQTLPSRLGVSAPARDRIHAAFDALLQTGCGIFVDVAGRGALLNLGRERHGEHSELAWINLPPSLPEFMRALGRLFVWGGVSVLSGFEKRLQRRVALPTYPFERKTFWIQSEGDAVRATPPSKRALLSDALFMPEHGTFFHGSLDTTVLPCLTDHRVHGEVVVPATALLGLARAACAGLAPGDAEPAYALRDVVLPAPLVVAATRALRIIVSRADSGADQLKLYAEDPGQPSGWSCHLTARIDERIPVSEGRFEPKTVQDRCSAELDVAQFYATFAGRGLDYGPSFRAIKALWAAEDEALGFIDVSEHESPAELGLHPGGFDAALQVAAASGALRGDSHTRVPFAIERTRWYGERPARFWAHARVLRRGRTQHEAVETQVRIYDATGVLCAEVDGLLLRPITAAALNTRVDDALDRAECALHWRSLPQGSSSGLDSLRGSRWLLIGGRAPLGEALAEGLRRAGAHVSVEQRDREAPGGLVEEALAARIAERSVEHVVYLDALCERHAREAEGGVEAGQIQVCAGALALVRVLDRCTRGRMPSPRAWFVTCGAVNAAESLAAPFQAPLWGLLRSAAREYPGLELNTIDLEPGRASTWQAERLLLEFQVRGEAREVALRGEVRYAPELVQTQSERRLERPANAPQYRLEAGADGSIESLALRPLERRQPGPFEIEISVRAGGLNFRDVLVALGSYPGERPALGGECAGTVSAVGSAVQGFTRGDEVIAIASGCFGPYVVTDYRNAISRPAWLDPEQAACLPVAYATAWYALHELGALRRGQRVLIHAASGGVGLAAVQLALRSGAEVFATASPAKWPILRRLGVKHVLNSRTLDFAEEVSELTSGAGVDIVVNSLTGAAIEKSLRSLKRGGRFIELGKRELWTPAQVAAVAGEVEYLPFDLAQVAPDLIQTMLRSIMQALEAGELRPLPTRAFELDRAHAAFRFMARAHHIGKIALRLDPELGRASAKVRAGATYLVAGGFGGLGIEVCRWLLRAGAQRVVAVGRRVQDTDAWRHLSRDATERGAMLEGHALDITDRAALRALLDAIDLPSHPLRGVVHTAGVLADGIISRMDWARMWEASAPKVQGAWLLHDLTLDRELDFFCLFSSAASVLGAPGQANYAAANAFLDGLAHYRRGLGLPGNSVNWGAWAELGMTRSVDATTWSRWASQGLSAIPSRDAGHWFDRTLTASHPQLAVIPADWGRYLAQLSRVPALLEGLGASVAPAPASRESAAPSPTPDAARELRGMDVSARMQRVQATVSRCIQRVLGREASDGFDPTRVLHELGLDSLMALELRNLLSREFQLELEAGFVFNYPHASAQSVEIAARMGLTAPDARPARGSTQVAESRAQRDELALEGLEDLDESALIAAAESELAAWEQEIS